MRQRCDILVPKERDAVFVHGVSMHLPGMLVSRLGVLQGLPGVLLPSLVILLNNSSPLGIRTSGPPKRDSARPAR